MRSIVERIAEGMPVDEYVIALLDIVPEIVRPHDSNDYFCREQVELWGVDSFYGLPHNSKVPYYRVGDRELGGGSKLFEFMIPMFPDTWLDPDAVARYSDELGNGSQATAVSLSILDVKGPAVFFDDPNTTIREHWCLSHYILDGHHKAFAASKSGHSIRLLDFLSLSQGISNREQVDRILR